MALDDESRNGTVRFGAKSDFVRSLNPEIPAAEVVALAQKRGMKLTTSFVYNIRSSERLRGKNGRAPRKRRTPYADGAEALLREAVAQIGLARARQILDEVEATFARR